MEKEDRYRLTEQGEASVVDLLGGQDVANVVAGFMQIIKTQGNALNNKGYEPTVTDYFQFVRIAQVIKHCENWANLVTELEKYLEEHSKWFERNPHSLE